MSPYILHIVGPNNLTTPTLSINRTKNYKREHQLLEVGPIISHRSVNIQPATTIDEAMALYRNTAKSHNELLAHYLILKDQYESLTRRILQRWAGGRELNKTPSYSR